MTDPTDDELGDALRRELSSSYVPYDAHRADEMIGRATQAQLLDARRWNAPLAAAAAVVLVGGGAAIIAANVGGGHRDSAPAGGGGYVASCGATPLTPAPIPPATSATPSPVAPSEALSTSPVPGVTLTLPSRIPAVSPPPSVVFPVAVSPRHSAPAVAPSVVPRPVARPVPSATATPSATDPCATRSASAPPASSSAPAPVPSRATSAAPSASTSPAYEPPIPPRPTSSGETNAVPVRIEVTADPNGTAGMVGPVIGADRRFVSSEVRLTNTVPASVGTLTLMRGGKAVLTRQLQDFGDTHVERRIDFTSDEGVSVTMSCSGPSACDATVTLFGNYVAR